MGNNTIIFHTVFTFYYSIMYLYNLILNTYTVYLIFGAYTFSATHFKNIYNVAKVASLQDSQSCEFYAYDKIYYKYTNCYIKNLQFYIGGLLKGLINYACNKAKISIIEGLKKFFYLIYM